MGLWLGLSYGLLEGLAVSALEQVPGALSWRNANSAHVLWFAPLFFGVVFTVIGGLFAFAARVIPRVRWDVALFFLAAWAAVILGSDVHPELLSPLAASILGMGVAYQLTRQYRKREVVWRRWMQRTLPWLFAVTAVMATLVVVGGRLRERHALAALGDPPPGAPNVLLLVIDTQRADHFSSYGYERATTPNLDRIAAEGALFERAYSPSSWTLPSHASMFVGRQLHEHDAGLMRRPFLDGRLPTLAEVMSAHGYATGGFVGNIYWCGRQTGLDRGFIRYVDMYRNLGDAVARTALGRLLAYDVAPRFGLIDVPGRRRAADIDTDLLAWIRGLQNRPFFAFVNYFDVHGPYLPPSPFAGAFSQAGADRHVHQIEIGALTGDVVVPPPAEIRSMIDRYDESMLYLDDQIGKLMAELETAGVLDRTIVIITSDHGESWGEHEMMYHGHSLYHEQLHVPLLIRYPPQVTAGQRRSAAVGLEWLPASVLELAGIDDRTFGSTTFFHPASGQAVIAELGRRSLKAASWPSSRGWLASVITDRSQFIRHESDPDELYDLVNDPAETVNLAAGDTTLTAPLAAFLNRSLPAGSLDPMPYPWQRAARRATDADR